MSVRVAPAGAHDRDGRPESIHERVRRGRSAAVMRDLEHVDRVLFTAAEPSGQEWPIDLLLDVAGQQEPSLAEPQFQDDRDVVDLFARVTRPQRHSSGERPVDVDLDAVEIEPIAGRDHASLAPELHETAPKRCVTWSEPDHSRLGNRPYPVPVEQQSEAGDVIFVRVCDDDEVEPPIPGGYACVE